MNPASEDQAKTKEQLIIELDQLRNSVQKARKSEDHHSAVASLGTIADGIAHDLNNHLMVILGNAEFCLMDLPVSCSGYSSMKTIQSETRKAAQLCRQLLSFSSKGKPQFQRVDLSSVIKQMKHLIKVPLAKTVRIEYKLAEDSPPIWGNTARLRQVIITLLGRAAEEAQDSDGLIEIETGIKNCDEAYLKDPSFDEKLPPGKYVFLRIRSVKSRLSEEPCGCGALNFITRLGGPESILGIIHKHDGALKIRKDETGSLILTALFPPAEEAAPTPRTPNEAQPASGKWRSEGIAILVDDEDEVRCIAERMLSALGFEVLCASNGPEAINLYKKNMESVKVVLLDSTMPDMSGAETMQEIRRLHPEAQIILTSGFEREQAMRGVFGEPPAGFIQKPYETEALASTVRDVVSAT